MTACASMRPSTCRGSCSTSSTAPSTGRIRGRLLDGSQNHVFAYSEVFDANPRHSAAARQEDDQRRRSRRIGGNRDTLDFKLYFALKDNLEQTGVAGAWQRIKDAALDLSDDGLHNGSAGVTLHAQPRRVQAVRARACRAGLHADDAGQYGRLLQRQGVRRQPRLPEARPRRRAQRRPRQHRSRACSRSATRTAGATTPNGGTAPTACSPSSVAAR